MSLTRLASGAGTLGDLLSLSSTLMKELTPGVSGAWYVPDESSDQLVAIETFGPAAAALSGCSVRVGERLTGWVAANRQVVINSDAALDLGERATVDGDPLRSCLSVPLMAGGTLAGVLSLYAREPDEFTEDLGRLIQMVGPHLASAIVEKRTAAEPLIQQGRGLKLVSSR